MNNDILKFLLGEGSLDGVWYGDKHPTEQGMFWWRKHLRQYLEQAQLQQHGDMQAEGSDGVSGAAVDSSAVGKGVCGGDCTCENVLDMLICTKQCYLPKQ